MINALMFFVLEVFLENLLPEMNYNNTLCTLAKCCQNKQNFSFLRRSVP